MPLEWNSLPASVRQCEFVAPFKSRLKLVYPHGAMTKKYRAQ